MRGTALVKNMLTTPVTTLKEQALQTSAASQKLLVLLQTSDRSNPEANIEWLDAAIRNVSNYLSMLTEGIHLADPKKVKEASSQLLQMQRYFFDSDDLVWTGSASQIQEALNQIHSSGIFLPKNIDLFNPQNLAEASQALP